MTTDNPTPSHELRTTGILPIAQQRSPRPRGEVMSSGSPASKQQSRREPRLTQGPQGAHLIKLLLESEVRGEFHAQSITEEKGSLFQNDKTHTKWEELLSLGRYCKFLFLVPEGQ